MNQDKFTAGKGGYRNLLLAIIGLLILRPLISEFATLYWLLPLFVTAVMLVAVWAVSSHRRQVLVPIGLVLVALLGIWSEQAGSALLHRSIPSLAVMIFFAWIAAILAADVFRHRNRVTAHVIYGGVNIYLLMGLAFAGAHHALVMLVPNAIVGLDANSALSDATYYSFVTLSTLGFGDITPTSEGARMLAYVEALFGQLYLAILLARLVALHLTQGSAGDKENLA